MPYIQPTDHQENLLKAIEIGDELNHLRDGLIDLEERTRRNGDMADQAVNAEIRRLLRLPVVR